MSFSKGVFAGRNKIGHKIIKKNLFFSHFLILNSANKKIKRKKGRFQQKFCRHEIFLAGT